MKPEIRLRAMEPEDLDLLYKIENDISLWNIGNTNVPYSRYTLHDYIANATGDIYADRQVRLMIENQEGCIVGIVDIVNFDAKNRKAEIGLVIENQFRRQGYATSALGEIAVYAWNVLHLHQLYAYIDTLNTASLHLFKNLGYEQSTELKHWLYDGKEYHNALLVQKFF